MAKRDYSLLGPNSQRAVEIGLAAAQWYHSDIPRKEMKALMRRSDRPALRDMALYYGSMIVLAGIGIALWPSWWSLPFWMGYSLLYTSGSDSRWHEAGHGTAFQTRWMNNVVYHIACFMLFRNPAMWRWSHARHHSDTIIVGRDPEIITMRPPVLLKLIPKLIGKDAFDGFIAMFRYAATGLNDEEKTFVHETDWPKVRQTARIWIMICLAVVGLAILSNSFLPLMLVSVGPAVLGSWHFLLTGLLQHTGMADNVIDHRLNSRTVLMNPISRFIYWNMNYHVEHHMFPLVPYHALPKLHEAIKDDLPAPNNGIVEGLREVLSALIKQRSDPEYAIEKTLPETARPYCKDFHDLALMEHAPSQKI